MTSANENVPYRMYQPHVVWLILLLACLIATWLGIRGILQQVPLGFYHDGRIVRRVFDPSQGVRPGDQLLSVAGRPLVEPGVLERPREQAETLSLEVERYGRPFTLSLRPAPHPGERKQVWFYGLGVLLLLMTLLAMMLPYPQRKRWGLLGLTVLAGVIFGVYLLVATPLRPLNLHFLFWVFAFPLGCFFYLRLPWLRQRHLVRGLNLIVALFIGITTSTEWIYPIVQFGYDGLEAQWDPERETAVITDITTFGLSDSPAARAGLRVGDRILAVNDHMLAENYVLAHKEWERRLQGRQRTVYQIERNGIIQEITVQGTRLPEVIQWTLLSRAALVFVTLLVLTFTLWKIPLEPRALVFAGMGYALIGVVRLLDQPPIAYLIDAPVLAFFNLPIQVGLLLAITSGPALFLHFFWIFPERKAWLGFLAEGTYLIYVPGLVVATEALFDLYRFGPVALALAPWMRWLALAYLIPAVFSMAHSYRTALQRRVKKQVRFVFLAMLVSTIAVVGGGLWAYTLLNQSWATRMFVALWGVAPIAFGYVIIKHRAMNISRILRWVLIYATTSLLVAAGWIVVYYGLLLRIFSGRYHQGVSTLGMALGVGFMMPRLERSVRTLIDRTFFREDYDYQQTLYEFSRALASVIDRDALLQMSVREVCEVMHVSRACILLLDEGGAIFKPAAWRGMPRLAQLQFNADGQFAQLLQERAHPITIEELERHQRSGRLSKDELQRLVQFDAELCVPILFQGVLKGIFLLGPKLSEDVYSREDMTLLSTLADQAAVTLENARLYEAQREQDRIRQELANARRIQRAILPETDPTPPGLELASFFQPAAEVGGDYYDYVALDAQRFGVAIGDVSGHGLDAGLLVSMAKSCLYTTTREVPESTTEAVETIMRMMNEMVCQVRARLLMTFAFSVIDRAHARLILANAGHPFPYHLHASGDLTCLEAGAYPLGVRTDVVYPCQQTTLERGDLIVFYSDGIVEANNPQGEPVGFERFEAILKSAPRTTAVACRDHILWELRQFCQNIPFVDDVTLIVARYLGAPANETQDAQT